VATGVVASDAAKPLERRLQQIYDGVGALLAEHAPSTVVIEDVYSEYKFPRTAIQMAHARGVICLAAQQRGIAVMTLPPASVKRAVAANGAASKSQVQASVTRHLRLATPPRPSHVADALALALTGFWRIGGRLP
jgi:crossover junction endodeoxyribonuclease RuvC